MLSYFMFVNGAVFCTGAKYDLPHYVLSDPVNLVKDETH